LFAVVVLYSASHFFYELWRVKFLKLISATIIVFQIKQVALTWDLNRLEAAVLSLTLGYIGSFSVLTYCQRVDHSAS
jgi:hypothetical protein